MPSARPYDRRKLIFIVTEDWFFASHFLPMARAAIELGLDVAVVTRVRRHRAAIEAVGARAIALEADRRSLSPFAAASAVSRLAAILKAERPDIVHCIALKSILVGGAAARIAGIQRRVFALTGLGLIGAKRDLVGSAARQGLKAAIRGPLETPQTRYLFENEDDPRLLGLEAGSARVMIVGGAGIDQDAFALLDPPPERPLKVAIVARMLWSKGVDVAVDALRLARAAGADVTLSLFGEPDSSNRRAISREALAAWSREEGIDWHGRTEDVVGVWRDHHVACLPSRGGEGLPRTLLEAAACGRAILTTDVPGCRSFVRDGVEGRVVAAGDAQALADALVALAKDASGLRRMGIAARERVLAEHTERHVMDAVKRLYGELLAP